MAASEASTGTSHRDSAETPGTTGIRQAVVSKKAKAPIQKCLNFKKASIGILPYIPEKCLNMGNIYQFTEKDAICQTFILSIYSVAKVFGGEKFGILPTKPGD